MMATWFVDQVYISTSQPTFSVPSVVHSRSADLSYFGMPEHLAKPEEVHLPLINIPNGRGLPHVPTYTGGNFTKYGEIASLIKESNNQFCIMQKGDGLVFTFAVNTDVDEGQQLSYFLNTDLVYKQQKCPGVPTVIDYLGTVEPLPFKGLDVYPPKKPLCYRRRPNSTWRSGILEVTSLINTMKPPFPFRIYG